MPENRPDTYVASRFKLTALIDGKIVSDIVSISGTFALNTIPTASLVLACGKNALTNQPASAHRILKDLKLRAPVKVFLEMIYTDGVEEKNPSAVMIIFDGYYAGFGFQRAQDNAQYTLHLVHWLDDLNTGSMLSPYIFPGAPFDFSESAVAGAADDKSASSIAAESSLDPGRNYINAANMEKDFWGESIKQVLLRLAQRPKPSTACGDTTNPKDVQKIVDALNRIPGNAPKPGTLPFSAGAQLLPDQISNAVHSALTHTGMQLYNYTTYWSVLVGAWGANFMFCVSPGVDFANIVPLFGGLRDYYKTIKADEYGYANFMSTTGQIIEGVNIYWSAPLSPSGIVGGSEEKRLPTSFCTPLGVFPPAGSRDSRGTVLVKEAPAWLGKYLTPSRFSTATTGLQGQNIGDATVPWWGSAVPPGGKNFDELREQIKNSGAGDKLAEQWYKQEVLQQRYGELSGKLRFDIAPGSTVKIEAPRRTMPDLPDHIDMVATVVKVSFVINAEQAVAGTSFTLSHIRSVFENDNPLFTSPEPPMYKTGWAGGPLTPQYAPADEVAS